MVDPPRAQRGDCIRTSSSRSSSSTPPSCLLDLHFPQPAPSPALFSRGRRFHQRPGPATRTTRRYCTGTLSRQSESTVYQRRTIKLCCDAKQLDQTDLVVAARASFFLVEPFLRFRLDSNTGFYIPHLWVRHQTLHHLLLLRFYGSPAIRL